MAEWRASGWPGLLSFSFPVAQHRRRETLRVAAACTKGIGGNYGKRGGDGGELIYVIIYIIARSLLITYHFNFYLQTFLSAEASSIYAHLSGGAKG